MRKEAGFEVTDRIAVYYTAEGRVAGILRAARFAPSVLANKVEEGVCEGGFGKELSINGERVGLTLVRV